MSTAEPGAPGGAERGPEDAGGLSIVDRFALKALVEACLLLEEGAAQAKDIDLGMMMGAGIMPGPLARADAQGLDQALAALERAEAEWGERFAAPLILRRLVAQGRLGQKAGQGFFPYARPDAGYEEGVVQLESRGEVAIAWLNRPPANPLSPQVLAELFDIWAQVRDDDAVRVMIVTSSNPFTFSAGADIKEFQRQDPAESAEQLARGHAALREMERSSTVLIAAVNSIAFGGGCELAMACDFRLAAASATFGQPEVNLGIIPGLGGTQRLPRLVGPAKALEMNLSGDAISAFDALEHGLVHAVVPDHELFDEALGWARRFAAKAPLAIRGIKEVSGAADLDDGLAAEGRAFEAVFGSEDAKEGIAAFVQKRKAQFRGK